MTATVFGRRSYGTSGGGTRGIQPIGKHPVEAWRSRNWVPSVGSMTALARTARTLIATLVAVGAVVVWLAAPATARTSVDPTTLNPAPPDSFNATCYRTGVNIQCDLAFSDPDIVDEPSGIVCDGTEMLYSQSRSVVGKRFYSGAGDLLRRHFREFFDGTFTNPDTGRVVLWTQHDTVLHDLSVPGDTVSGTIKTSGLETRAWLPGGGTVLTDAGRLLVDAATEEVVHLSAHHPFDAYFSGADPTALAGLCDALGS